MSGKELIKQLQKEGWIVVRIEGSHHVMKKGSKTVIVPVHSNKDIPKGLLNRILKDSDLR